MSNDFGNLFEADFNVAIRDIIGDTVSVAHPENGATLLQVVFKKAVDIDGLQDRIDDYYPHLIIDDDQLSWFKDRKATVTYNLESFTIYSVNPHPKSKLRHIVSLQDVR